MSETDRKRMESRVLVLATPNKDAALAARVLTQAGVEAVVCEKLEGLCGELGFGASVALIPEEAVASESRNCLSRYLAQQPPWSDLPLLVLARPGADSTSVAEAMDLLGNVTVLERPMRVAALVSAVRTAQRARRRQFQIREYLIERTRAEEALRKADRRKDEFLAILAHELRNPLAPLRNSLAVLRLSGRDGATAQRVSEMMERQVDHMVRLVDDLLEVSRITSGKIELRRERVDLSLVVRNAVETSRPFMEEGGHELVVTMPAERLTVDGDLVRLSQIFANLLNNAAKYTDGGGRIALTAARDGQQVVISVRDTGTGIPVNMLPRVFELFTQVDSTAGRAHGGLGIGLTLVKSLVEMHGGSVEARSEGTGQGSEFVVRLPLNANVEALPQSMARPAADEAWPSRRVLVVDDNRDAAESLAILLELLGVNAQVVNSGREALDAVVQQRPAVILLDLGMPGMDGYEVARRIRASPENQDLMLVALTGWGQEEDRRRTQLAGFDHHLTKPVDVPTLQLLLASNRGPAITPSDRALRNARE